MCLLQWICILHVWSARALKFLMKKRQRKVKWFYTVWLYFMNMDAYTVRFFKFMAFVFTDTLAAKVPEEDSKEKSEQVFSTSHSTQDPLNTDSSTTSKENKGKMNVLY